MPKILRLYAYLAEEGPDDEGVVSMKVGDTWVPMRGADMKRMEALRDIAQGISTATGKKIILTKFQARTDHEVIRP